MTVTTTENTRSYTGNGSTTVFSFPYLFYENGHLSVIVDGVTKILDTDYSVSGAENPNGGSVTFNTAPASGTSVILQRIVPYDQQTDFENFDGNPAVVTETQFDLIVMQTQQLAEEQNRTILAPLGTVLSSNEIAGTIDSNLRLLTITSSGPSATLLSSLSLTGIDVVVTSEADGDYLRYDGTNWVNRTTAETLSDLGLEIGTDVQAYDVDLAAIAGLTSAANKIPMFSGVGTATVIDFVDEDNMASDSATAVPSQQSVKAYVDSEISAIDFAAGIAALSAGGVGTYMAAAKNTAGSTNDFGSTLAGSNLDPSSFNLNLSAIVPAGTWQCMGYSTASTTIASATIWKRTV